jgi:hypothetical protein
LDKKCPVPVGVAVAVVITKKIVLLAMGIMGYFKGLVHGREELLSEMRNKINQTGQVVFNLRRRHPPHKIKRTIQLVGHTEKSAAVGNAL